MNPALILFCLILPIAALPANTEPDRFYVAVDGNDTYNGRSVRSGKDGIGPFATLERARNAVRSLKDKGLSSPVEVIIQPGTYYLDKPLELTAEDSGTKSCPITYRAAKRGAAVISGGLLVKGWEKAGANLWSARLPVNISRNQPVRLLRVNNQWATRARFPNIDAKDPITSGWLFAKWHGTQWGKGAFNNAVYIPESGGSLMWHFQSPAYGEFRVWVRYAHNNGRDIAGQFTLQANDDNGVALTQLPDAGGWGNFWGHNYRWSEGASAVIKLHKGDNTISLTSAKGGAFNLDALLLSDDPAWDARQGITNLTWWGNYTLQGLGEGRNIITIQAEACSKRSGEGVAVPSPVPPGSKTHLRFASGEIPEWKDIQGADLHIFPAWGWVNAIAPVKHIDYENFRIELEGEGLKGTGQDVRIGNRYFIEGVRETLDFEGEWVLDHNTERLMYYSEAKTLQGKTFTVPVLDRLITIKGDREKGRPVQHINIRGLVFTDTRYNIIEDYYMPDDSALMLTGSNDCRIEACEFRLLGGSAAQIGHGCRDISFTGNRIDSVGQSGVILASGDKMLINSDRRNALHPGPCRISVTGNTITNIGLIYKHVGAVMLVDSSDNHIANNTISDSPRYGISLNSSSADKMCRRNIIEYNEVRRTLKETHDAAALHSFVDGDARLKKSGNVFKYNMVLDTFGLGTDSGGNFYRNHQSIGIYLDNYSSGFTVYGNIFARSGQSCLLVSGGGDNTVENNIFVDGGQSCVRYQNTSPETVNNIFIKNICVWEDERSQMLSTDLMDHKQPGLFIKWDENLYWMRSGSLEKVDYKCTPEGSFASWRAVGFDKSSRTADPLFSDLSKDDFRLKKQSPAWKLGFHPIPVEKIGARYWLVGNSKR